MLILVPDVKHLIPASHRHAGPGDKMLLHVHVFRSRNFLRPGMLLLLLLLLPVRIEQNVIEFSDPFCLR